MGDLSEIKIHTMKESS